jgi:hypothetical protein
MRPARTAIAILCFGSASFVYAQDADPRDQLMALATIEVAHDLCGFDLSDAQEDAIVKTRGKLIDDGAVSDADAAAIHDEIASSMARQVPEGLCKPDGAEARLYKRKLAELGSP